MADQLLKDIKAHPDVYFAGIVFGAIIAILIYVLYMYYMGMESFMNPNDLDPATKALLAYHLTSDPVGMVSPKLVGGRNAKTHL